MARTNRKELAATLKAIQSAPSFGSIRGMLCYGVIQYLSKLDRELSPDEATEFILMVQRYDEQCKGNASQKVIEATRDSILDYYDELAEVSVKQYLEEKIAVTGFWEGFKQSVGSRDESCRQLADS